MIRFTDDTPKAAAKTAPKTAAKPTDEPRTTIDLDGRSISVPGAWTDGDLAPFLKALGAAKLNEKTVGKTKVGRHLMSTLGDPAAVTAELTTLAAAVRAGLA